jgi:hypothetical protein
MRKALVFLAALAAVALTACSTASTGTSPAPAQSVPGPSVSPEQVGTLHDQAPDDGLIGTSEAPLNRENGVG